MNIRFRNIIAYQMTNIIYLNRWLKESGGNLRKSSMNLRIPLI